MSKIPIKASFEGHKLKEMQRELEYNQVNESKSQSQNVIQNNEQNSYIENDNQKDANDEGDVNGKGNLDSKGIESGKDQEIKNDMKQEKQEAQITPPLKLFEFLFQYAKRKDYSLFIPAVLLSLISGATSPIYAYFIGKAMKILNLDINTQTIENDLNNILIIYSCLGFGLFLINFYCFILWNKFGITMTARYKKYSLVTLFNQNQDLFDSINPFQLTSYLETQFFSIEVSLGNKLGGIISAISKIITGVIIAMLISWKISLILISIIPISILIGNYAAKVLANNQKLTYEKISAAGAILEEMLYQIKTVSSFANFKFEFDRYDSLVKQARDLTIKNNTKSSLYFGVIFFLKYFNYFVAIFYGSIIISNKEINFLTNQIISGGEINTIILCLIYSGFGISNIMDDLKDLHFARAAAAQLKLLEDEKPQAEDDNRETNKPIKINEKIVSRDKIKGEIEFKNVNFHYPEHPDKIILKNFNLKIQAGKKVAVVGESGSGKSTIVNLIERLYDIKEGEILIDGRNILDYDIEFLRSIIGYVQQEPVLFDRSVKENIIFYRDVNKYNITDHLVELCARKSLAMEFIEKIDETFDYKVGIKGKKLSGGQKQRVAIARAILLNPKILILDEATSALDNSNEKEVQKSLDCLDKNLTQIIVAHRLSTIINADVIVAMKEGEILEIGTHSELLSKNAYYAKLFSSQVIEEIPNSIQLKSNHSKNNKNNIKNRKSNTDDSASNSPNNGKNKDFIQIKTLKSNDSEIIIKEVNVKQKVDPITIPKIPDAKHCNEKTSISIDLLNESYRPSEEKRNFKKQNIFGDFNFKNLNQNNNEEKNNNAIEIDINAKKNNSNINNVDTSSKQLLNKNKNNKLISNIIENEACYHNKEEINFEKTLRKSLHNGDRITINRMESINPDLFKSLKVAPNYYSLNENLGMFISNFELNNYKKKDSDIQYYRKNSLIDNQNRILEKIKDQIHHDSHSISDNINNVLSIRKSDNKINVENNNKRNNPEYLSNKDFITTKNEHKSAMDYNHIEKNLVDDILNINKISYLNPSNERLNFISFMKSTKGLIALGILNSCFNGSITPIYGLLLAISLTILSNSDPEYVKQEGFKISMIYLALSVVATILNYIQQFLSTRIKETYCQTLRSFIFEKFLKIHISYFDIEENNPGALISRIAQDLHNINDILFFLIEELLKSSVLLLLGLGISFTYDWRLTLIGIGMFPIIIFSLYIQVKYKNALIVSYNQMTADAGDILSESLINTKTLFIFNVQKKIVKMYTKIIKDGLRSLINQSAITGLADGFEEFINFLSYGLTFYAGGHFILNKTLTYEDMMKCIFSISFFTVGLSSIQKNLGNLPVAREAIKRMFNLIRIEDFIIQDKFVSLSESNIINNKNILPARRAYINRKIEGKIEFRNVYFSYPHRPEALILRNVSFKIEIGQKVAIVGSSGSGKSTIIQLIQRFYDPISGEILIDNINIKDYDIFDIRKQLGLVMQEPVIFKRSVEENIEYGKLGSRKEEIRRAAEKANIADLLDDKTKNIDGTFSNVSGGQKQRISIARVVLKDPNILLFDEATSALDEESEKEVMLAINKISENKTSISIAHRLKTIENSDVIIVMENGKIVEKGTHKELLKLKGFYHKQYNFI